LLKTTNNTKKPFVRVLRDLRGKIYDRPEAQKIVGPENRMHSPGAAKFLLWIICFFVVFFASIYRSTQPLTVIAGGNH
jgi:hypothetical protein